jgi:hypothetical protein
MNRQDAKAAKRIRVTSRTGIGHSLFDSVQWTVGGPTSGFHFAFLGGLGVLAVNGVLCINY